MRSGARLLQKGRVDSPASPFLSAVSPGLRTCVHRDSSAEMPLPTLKVQRRHRQLCACSHNNLNKTAAEPTAVARRMCGMMSSGHLIYYTVPQPTLLLSGGSLTVTHLACRQQHSKGLTAAHARDASRSLARE
jgi:hypothetical protein